METVLDPLKEPYSTPFKEPSSTLMETVIDPL